MSATLIERPATARASAAHASAQVPQLAQAASVTMPVSVRPIACCGHTTTQEPHKRQRSAEYRISGGKFWLSGLWHHQQRSGQPLKNTAVRIPGPSWTANRMTLKTTALSAFA